MTVSAGPRRTLMAELWAEALALEAESARRWQVQRIRIAFAARVRRIQGLPPQAGIVIWRPQPYVVIAKTPPDYKAGKRGEHRIDTFFGSDT